jgi:hypothetical protein
MSLGTPGPPGVPGVPPPPPKFVPPWKPELALPRKRAMTASRSHRPASNGRRRSVVARRASSRASIADQGIRGGTTFSDL